MLLAGVPHATCGWRADLGRPSSSAGCFCINQSNECCTLHSVTSGCVLFSPVLPSSARGQTMCACTAAGGRPAADAAVPEADSRTGGPCARSQGGRHCWHLPDPQCVLGDGALSNHGGLPQAADRCGTQLTAAAGLMLLGLWQLHPHMGDRCAEVPCNCCGAFSVGAVPEGFGAALSSAGPPSSVGHGDHTGASRLLLLPSDLGT